MANDPQELETVVVARQPIFDAGWDVVGELPFDDRLADALLRREGPEGAVLRATLAFERGDFDDAAAHARPEVLADAYRQAIVWSDQFAPATA